MNFGREEDADQQRGGAADQDLAPSAAPSAERRPRRRSSATPREPLTSTVSPRPQPRRAAAPPPACASSAWKCSPPAKLSPAQRGARPDGDQQRDAGVGRLLAELAVVALLVGRAQLEHVAEHGDAPPAAPSRRARSRAARIDIGLAL